MLPSALPQVTGKSNDTALLMATYMDGTVAATRQQHTGTVP